MELEGRRSRPAFEIAKIIKLLQLHTNPIRVVVLRPFLVIRRVGASRHSVNENRAQSPCIRSVQTR